MDIKLIVAFELSDDEPVPGFYIQRAQAAAISGMTLAGFEADAYLHPDTRAALDRAGKPQGRA